MVVTDGRRRSFGGRRLGPALLALLCSGCFSYLPADVRSLAPDRDVRLELTRVGFAQLPEIPNRPGPELTGRVTRAEADRIVLRVPVAIRSDGMVTGTIRQEVVIPAADIVRVEQRVFSRRRSAVVALGGVGALVGTLMAFGSGGPPVGQEPEKPIDEEAGSGTSGFSLRVPISILFR
jgi:hypothetical protein